MLVSLTGMIASFRYPEKNSICWILIGSLMLVIKGAPADLDTQTCCLPPTLYIVGYTRPTPLNKPLVTIPKAPITIGIIVTFLFHSFFQFPSKVEVLILLFAFFQFYSVVSWDSKVDNFVSSLLFVDYY